MACDHTDQMPGKDSGPLTVGPSGANRVARIGKAAGHKLNISFARRRNFWSSLFSRLLHLATDRHDLLRDLIPPTAL